MEEETMFVCRNCGKEFALSDAEDFEQFCSAICESEYGTDIDSDEQYEYFQQQNEDRELEIALEIKRGIY